MASARSDMVAGDLRLLEEREPPPPRTLRQTRSEGGRDTVGRVGHTASRPRAKLLGRNAKSRRGRDGRAVKGEESAARAGMGGAPFGRRWRSDWFLLKCPLTAGSRAASTHDDEWMGERTACFLELSWSGCARPGGEWGRWMERLAPWTGRAPCRRVAPHVRGMQAGGVASTRSWTLSTSRSRALSPSTPPEARETCRMVRHRSVRSESQEEPGLAHTPHGELGGEHGRSVAVLTLGGGREYGQVTV